VIRILSGILFYGWAGALLVLGGIGVFTGRWELAVIFHIDLERMGEEARANLLNQYRFLKGIEFGFGLFCFLFRQEIFRVPRFNRLFVAIVFFGAAARALAIALEGWPHWAFIVVTGLEFMTGFAVVIASRKTLERA
jgi:hypothetical protein